MTIIVLNFLKTLFFKSLNIQPRRDTRPEMNERVTSAGSSEAFESSVAPNLTLQLFRSKYTELCSQNCYDNQIPREDEAVF